MTKHSISFACSWICNEEIHGTSRSTASYRVSQLSTASNYNVKLDELTICEPYLINLIIHMDFTAGDLWTWRCGQPLSSVPASNTHSVHRTSTLLIDLTTTRIVIIMFILTYCLVLCGFCCSGICNVSDHILTTLTTLTGQSVFCHEVA